MENTGGRSDERVNLKDLTQKEMEALFAEWGVPPFRARQIFGWLAKGVSDWDGMRNVPEKLKKELSERAYIGSLSLLDQQRAADGTRKFLFGVEGGDAIETVFMKYRYGASLCISSQVGCRMGCRFCASTKKGLVRGLSAGEMIDQVLAASRETGKRISHVVVMGIGEPFDNYENLSRFLRIIHDPAGLGLSYRNITVSTCGLVGGIKAFGRDFPQVNLAVSLHAPNDRIRRSIMPVAERWDMKTLLDACREHAVKTGRRVTFEYAMIEGVNDSDRDLVELIENLRGMLCHVNLIPLNRVDESGYKGSPRQRVSGFCEELNRCGIPATIRRSLGTDIDAACGQLRLARKGSRSGPDSGSGSL